MKRMRDQHWEWLTWMPQPLQWCGCCDWTGCPRSWSSPSSGSGGGRWGWGLHRQAPGLQTTAQHMMKLSGASKHAYTSHLQICLHVTAIYTRVASTNSRHATVAVEMCSHSASIWLETGCSLAPLTSLTNWLLYASGSVRQRGRKRGRCQKKNRCIISFMHSGGG